MRPLIFSFSALLTLAHIAALGSAARSPQQGASGRGRQTAEVARIESYCKGIDQYLKSAPKAVRYFVNARPEDAAGSRAAERWYEVKSGDELTDAERSYATESISVLTKAGAIVYALIGEPMEHSRHDDAYYFREDGALAKISSGYWSNMAEMRILRENFYDSSGKLLQSTSQCFQLSYTSGGSSREKRVSCARGDMKREIREYRFPIYKRSSDLPGYALLKKS
jgi:hypothetical protein